MSIVIPNPACAEQCTTTTDTTSSIIWLEVVVPGAWKGISWAGGSESIIAVQGDAGIGTGSPWISIDSGTSWANQAGAFPAPLPLTSVACSDPAVSAGGPDATAVVTASASSVVHRTTNSGTNWNTQAIAGPDSYGCSAITADGTHVIVGRGDGLEYTNDAFDAAGAWVTSGAGGSAMTVAGVSPSKTSAIGDADGCDCEPSVTDGYKVYYGYDPATPFVVSGPTFVWNTGVPTIVGSGSPSLNWTGVTLSNNGRFALATATGEKIKTASNWGSPGAQWGTLANSPALNWFGIAARRDLNTGSFGTIAAIERPGSIWMSFDNGAAWAAMPGTSGKNWSGITCKSDGSAFAATVDGENIWIYPFTSTTTTTSSICGPVPPRLWSRAQPDCIHTSATLTQQDLDMRRKAEILQYKNNNSNMSKKQLWARTIKGHGPSGNRTWATQSADGTYTNPNIDNLKPSGAFTLRCPGRPNNCAPTSNSDVPGKQMILCMRPDVPLTNYIVNRTYLAGGTKWPQTAWKPGDKGFPVGKSGRNLVFK